MWYEILRVFLSSLVAGLLTMKGAAKLWDWWHKTDN
jgi:hypothetical protein